MGLGVGSRHKWFSLLCFPLLLGWFWVSHDRNTIQTSFSKNIIYGLLDFRNCWIAKLTRPSEPRDPHTPPRLLPLITLLSTWWLYSLTPAISSCSGEHGCHGLLNLTSWNYCSPRDCLDLSHCLKEGFLTAQLGSCVFHWTNQLRPRVVGTVPTPPLTVTLTVLWFT